MVSFLKRPKFLKNVLLIHEVNTEDCSFSESLVRLPFLDSTVFSHSSIVLFANRLCVLSFAPLCPLGGYLNPSQIDLFILSSHLSQHQQQYAKSSLLDLVHLLHHTQSLQILCLPSKTQSKNQWNSDSAPRAATLSSFINWYYDFRSWVLLLLLSNYTPTTRMCIVNWGVCVCVCMCVLLDWMPTYTLLSVKRGISHGYWKEENIFKVNISAWDCFSLKIWTHT